MKNSIGMRLGASLSVLFVGVFASGADARGAACLTVSAARELPLGSCVALTALVSVPSGAFDDGFAIQQGRAGIYVTTSDGAAYAIGDEVNVRGVLIDASGLLAVEPSSITLVRKHAAVVPPRPSTTGAVGENTEGQLLHITGSMTGPLIDDSPYGYKLDVDDGSGPVQVFLYPGAGIATAGLVSGVRVSVVCFSNQYLTTYECDPRVPADVTIVHRP